MKRIPLLDLEKQIAPIRQELDAAIGLVIDKGNFILGEEVRGFEEAVTGYCGIKNAVGVSNGTDAIKISLAGLGVRPGEGVICPAFTYYATAGAVVSAGAVPVFADIDPDTYNILPAEVEKRFKQAKKVKITAVIPVHLFGQCADMDNIISIAREFNLLVIEDTAQAFGAEYRGKKAGTMGNCGTVSFFPGKNLGAFGDAGMVLTGDDSLAQNLRVLRNQGNVEKYRHLALGFNHRLDTLQAAVLKVKIKYLDSWNKKRQEHAAYFNKNLEGLKIKTPLVAGSNTHIYHQYVLRLGSSSRKLIEHLQNKGIDARVYYPLPLHLQECFKYLGYKKGDFPVSEAASEQALAIPVHPDLTQEEMDYIIASIREFIR